MTATAPSHPPHCQMGKFAPLNVNDISGSSSPATSTSTPPNRAVIWCARAAGLILAAACIATNSTYALARGGDVASMCIGVAVAAATGIVATLAAPAFSAAVSRREVARASQIGIAWLLAVSFSVVAALGSMGGSRLDATSTATHHAEQHARAVTTLRTAEQSLVGIPAGRSAAELAPLIRAAKARTSCDKPTGGAIARCQDIANLEAEAARSTRRDTLTAEIAKARAALDYIRPAKATNADAIVLAQYTAAVGVTIDPARLALLITLLAVVLLEAGGGLAFAVADALAVSQPVAPTEKRASSTASTAPTSDRTQPPAAIPEPEPAEPAKPQQPPASGQTPDADRTPSIQPDAKPVSDLIDLLRARNGVLCASQASIAKTLGASKSRTGEILHALADAGRITLTTTPKGSVVQLVAAH
jgi:hypothetical protein